MPVDALPLWKTTLAALPPSDSIWAPNFSNWYVARIIGISPDPSALVAPGFVFTFGTSAFQSALSALPPSDSPSAATGFANAWESGLLASTITVLPGAFIPPTSPTTLFSQVITAIIDPPSILAGKAKLAELTTALPTDNPLDSQFPVKFREATLLLTISINGLDSTTPPPVLPLAALNIPLV